MSASSEETQSYRRNAMAKSLSKAEMEHYLEAFLGSPVTPRCEPALGPSYMRARGISAPAAAGFAAIAEAIHRLSGGV